MQHTQHRDRNLLSVSFSLPSPITNFYTQGSEQRRELKTRGIQWFCPDSLRSHHLPPLTCSPWPFFPSMLHDASFSPLLSLAVSLFSPRSSLSPPPAHPTPHPQLLLWLAVLNLLILFYKRLLNSFSPLRPSARPQGRSQDDRVDYVHSFP